jgi:GT2 family glycosyltransferase
MIRHSAHVYIIILNYKNWHDVAECLESIFLSDYHDFTIIVVDNDSGNDSLQHLMVWADGKELGYRHFDRKDWSDETVNPDNLRQLNFLQNDVNNGFAAGNNLALRALLKENACIWLLNPDMVIQQNTLSELVAFAGRHPFKSIIGSVIKQYEPPHDIHLYGGGHVNFNTATVTLAKKAGDIPGIRYVSGGALFSHAAHFNDIGVLPEEYFLYWEETDWCYRAAAEGYAMLVCPTAVCYDKISTTIGRSFLADYYYTRNGLLFLRKYKGKISPMVFVFVFFRFLKRVASGRWGRAKGVYKGALSFLKADLKAER